MSTEIPPENTIDSMNNSVKIDTDSCSIGLDGHFMEIAGTVPIAQLDLASFIQGVRDAHEYYTDPRNTEGHLNERLRKRNLAIRKLFTRLKETRISEHEKHRLYQIIEIRCKNPRPGGHKSCPGSYDFGVNYEVTERSIGYDGSGVKSVQKASASTFSWHQQTEGDNTNHARVWATALLPPASVSRLVEAELKQLRSELFQRNLPDDQAFDPI